MPYPNHTFLTPLGNCRDKKWYGESHTGRKLIEQTIGQNKVFHAVSGNRRLYGFFDITVENNPYRPLPRALVETWRQALTTNLIPLGKQAAKRHLTWRFAAKQPFRTHTSPLSLETTPILTEKAQAEKGLPIGRNHIG